MIVVGWGRGEESWRLFWNELRGNPADPSDGVWSELDAALAKPIPMEGGGAAGYYRR
ncbi:terminase gpA endonuclease subunit [Pseudomonas aeruginosa]